MKDILAQYNFNSVTHVESNQYYTHTDEILLLAIHEFSHLNLTQSTSFGAFNFILETAKKHYINNLEVEFVLFLEEISKILVECSEITQECLSHYLHYAAVKFSDKEGYQKKIDDFKKTDAFVCYKISKIVTLLEHKDWRNILKSNIVFRIASLAMNVKKEFFYNECIMRGEYLTQNIIKYNNDFMPDYRFIRLLDALNHLLETTEIDSITDGKLLSKANLVSTDFSKDFFIELANYLKDIFREYALPIAPIDNLIKLNTSLDKPIQINDISDLFDLIRPSSINDNYEMVPMRSLYHYESENIQGIFSSVWIVIVEKSYMVMFDDVSLGKRYFFLADMKDCESLLLKYDLPITVYSEDYEDILIQIPLLIEREVFIYHDSPYKKSKIFIEKHLSKQKEIMFCNLNSDIVVVFIKLEGDSILVMFHTKYSLQLIVNDIKEGKYKYINSPTNIDGVFWNKNTDWCKYEDIIKSFSQTYVFDPNPKIPPLGNRVNITGFDNRV
ncbi:hypothetical protein PPOLYM_01872 [Paenibacillus polymyxa]|uniref:hypothetical protein n=1 Tax=Paenibacillus polymyxa TaxID=1406 RepID=UPI0009474B63|nr:hypothetical protein [Paenibacillus polymyxa]APQ60626.1 hypothetical protein VK72_18845 [Paenibacillus polymyxa]VUG05491.1 hypothetical protein PPOLYM_01872 [Paenibacillus polymyxa]